MQIMDKSMKTLITITIMLILMSCNSDFKNGEDEIIDDENMVLSGARHRRP